MENRLAGDLEHILDHTRELWEELRGERLFITGGTGFFGCWLLESFLWANDRLGLNANAIVLSRNPDALEAKASHLVNRPAIQFIKGDTRTFPYPPGHYSYVIHAATETNAQFNQAYPLEMLETIVDGTRRTLDFARQSGAGKFLLTSSGAIYGPQPPKITHVPEDYPGGPDPLNPNSGYGEAKRMAETLCSVYFRTHGLQAKIARCFAFVGPYLPLDEHYAIGNFIHDGLRGGPVVVKGDGTPYRSYLYAADLVVWLWKILFQGSVCRPYNVGSEVELTIRELANLVASSFQPIQAVTIKQEPKPGAIPERYVPLTQRARDELDLYTWIDLQEALRRTIKWNKGQSAL